MNCVPTVMVPVVGCFVHHFDVHKVSREPHVNRCGASTGLVRIGQGKMEQDDAGKSEQQVGYQPRIEKSIGLKRPLFEPSAEQAVRPHTISISARRSM